MNGKIYVIKNKLNNKVYVGQTIQDVEKRFKQHLKLSIGNKNQIIYKAISSIGKENFYYETLEENIVSYEELNKLEEKYILLYNSITPNGYNLCPGGQKWRRKPKIDESEYDNIIRDYVENEMSLRLLAKKYNVSHSTIIDVLDKNNIQRRKRNNKLPDRTSKVTREIMEDLYINKKMMIKDIAELLNISVRNVSRAKNRYNIKRV